MKLNLQTKVGQRRAAQVIKYKFSVSQSWEFFYKDGDFQSPGLSSYSAYEEDGYDKVYVAHQLNAEEKAPFLHEIEADLAGAR